MTVSPLHRPWASEESRHDAVRLESVLIGADDFAAGPGGKRLVDAELRSLRGGEDVVCVTVTHPHRQGCTVEVVRIRRRPRLEWPRVDRVPDEVDGAVAEGEVDA